MYAEQEDRVLALLAEGVAALQEIAAAQKVMMEFMTSPPVIHEMSDEDIETLRESLSKSVGSVVWSNQMTTEADWRQREAQKRDRVRVQDPMDKFNAPKTTSADPNEDFFGPVTNHGGIK